MDHTWQAKSWPRVVSTSSEMRDVLDALRAAKLLAAEDNQAEISDFLKAPPDSKDRPCPGHHIRIEHGRARPEWPKRTIVIAHRLSREMSTSATDCVPVAVLRADRGPACN